MRLHARAVSLLELLPAPSLEKCFHLSEAAAHITCMRIKCVPSLSCAFPYTRHVDETIICMQAHAFKLPCLPSCCVSTC